MHKAWQPLWWSSIKKNDERVPKNCSRKYIFLLLPQKPHATESWSQCGVYMIQSCDNGLTLCVHVVSSKLHTNFSTVVGSNYRQIINIISFYITEAVIHIWSYNTHLFKAIWSSTCSICEHTSNNSPVALMSKLHRWYLSCHITKSTGVCVNTRISGSFSSCHFDLYHRPKHMVLK